MAVNMVVEDGTGLATANSFLSVANLKQYWDNMGYDYSALTDEQIEILLIKSTRVIDGTYGNKWPGARNSSTQGLGWPRTNATYRDGYSIDSDIVPDEVGWAVAEAAYASNAGTELQPIDDKNNITEYSVVVDIIEETTKYESGTGAKRPEVTAVKDALARLIRFGGYGGIGILRI